MTAPARPFALSLASTLGFAWGTVMLAVSIAVTIPAVAKGASPTGMAAPLALSIASCAAAVGIWRRRWKWFDVGVSAAWIAFLVMVPLKVTVLGILMNFLILGLVLTNLKLFR